MGYFYQGQDYYDYVNAQDKKSWVEDPDEPGFYFWKPGYKNDVYLWNGAKGDAQITNASDWRYRLLRVSPDAIKTIARDGSAEQFYLGAPDGMVDAAQRLVDKWARDGGPATKRRYGPMWTVD